MTTGFLLVGHGTRNQRGRSEFLQLAQAIKAALAPSHLAAAHITAAFLELAEPTIDAAIRDLRGAGVTEIVCAPVILLAAAHVKRDIPHAVHAAAEAHGIESVRFVEHLGCCEAMLEVSACRFREAAGGTGRSNDAGWLLVGRGTHDPDALAELDRFLTLREQRQPTAAQWLGFLAMAEPKLSTTLEAAARSAHRQIVVQPHLLFHGDLLDRTATAVADTARRYPEKKWILAEHIGPDDAIAASISRQLADSVGR